MKTIIDFFIRFAPFIYLLLTVGLILGIRRLFLARSETREAIYGLEREIAHHHSSQAISTLTLIGFLALAEFVLIVFLGPNLPALARLPTSTMNAIAISTSTLSPEVMGTLGARTPDVTATVQLSGCIPGVINITFPKAGDEIKGSITLIGDANIPDFGFYKYEFSPRDSESWLAVEANRKPVINDKLGTWDTTSIAQGDYQLRLVVTDNQGNELPACVIPVRIKTP
jgi:hypothetical protein